MRASVRLSYGVLTTVYATVVYWLSSIPQDALGRHDHPAVLALSNLAHAPIYAGLAFCVLRTFSGPRPSWEHYAAAFLLTSAAALFDEWLQSFVPGRTMSAADWLLDVSGITTALVLVRLRNMVVEPECEAE